MSDARRLLITCDDLGYHPTINQAVVEVLAGGVVRSTSIMPAAPYFDDALRRLAAAGVCAAGVHLTIGSEYARLPVRPLNDPSCVPSLVQANGAFFRDLTAVRERIAPREVALEFRSQIERVRQSGLRLTHLNGHMFCYETDVGGAELLAIAEALAQEYALPMRVRSLGDRGPASEHPHAATTGQSGTPRIYMRWLRGESVADRLAYYTSFFATYADPLAELIIHPGADPIAMGEFSTTGERRLADYLFFCGAAFPELIRERDIQVVGWDEL